jgi:dCTP diphosphatase
VCGEIFLRLFDISLMCGVDLRTCILKKMELNGKKYPVELCRGKSGKYTNYSDATGITSTVGQCTIDSPTKMCTNDMEDDVTVEGITLLVRNFANERQWYRYHTPRNIALAIMGEFGELSELFQWMGDGDIRVVDAVTEEVMDKVGQEIADVAIYLIRLCDVCNIPLGEVSIRLLDERS